MSDPRLTESDLEAVTDQDMWNIHDVADAQLRTVIQWLLNEPNYVASRHLAVQLARESGIGLDIVGKEG